MLHAQGRIAQNPADHKTQQARAEKGHRPGNAGQRHQTRDISPDADKGALGHRHLSGITQCQVETQSGHRNHQPHGNQIEAEIAQIEGGGDQQGSDKKCKEDFETARGEKVNHTVRSSARPINPCGRHKITTINKISGIAPRYWAEI